MSTLDYSEFTALLNAVGPAQVLNGRKFDRVKIDGAVRYFIDKDSRIIYGAKSAVQYNPRREYGTLDTIRQIDWATGTPLPNTAVADYLEMREVTIAGSYKKRGRPKKNGGTP